MVPEHAALDWPPDPLESEEQDEPLAGQDHRDTIDRMSYHLRGRLAGPNCCVAAGLRVLRDRNNRRDDRGPDILVALGVAGWVRVVDRRSGKLFPPIVDVEPQLRQEIALRRTAQEQAQLAEGDARLAVERERRAMEHAHLALERERLAVERRRQ